MEGTCCDSNLESLSAGVYDLPGEPAVVINGVPDVPVVEDGNIIQGIDLADRTPSTVKLCNSASDTGKRKNTGFGEWLEGRKVEKLFDGRYYLGRVTEFDKESGWYRVVYEDGDLEDLEWHELQDVLQPLDITMPLKSLALKMIHKSQKSEPGIETNVATEIKRGGKTRGRRGRPPSRNLVDTD
ncbi:hypothetical protein SOVF_009950 [Spinacia oleracea]|uniref:Dirigent protein 17 n=1 Tax=Spinacia oleracea TaxID=3562 RepID=A0A9R0JTX5_SPIOL|nr:dirigent protein 17-like [Spinacia oleracea]KNA25062.1 hypothetical protein SOVF_009950 [Spinacia oleracea]